MAIIYNAFFIYNQLHTSERLKRFISNDEAKILDKFILAFRQIYQDIFIREHIPLNERTAKLLPVVTTPKISETFSKLLSKNVIIRTVSDHPHDPKNWANELESQTIRYFRTHPQARIYQRMIQKGAKEYFYYAVPLYVTPHCLACHGEKAPRTFTYNPVVYREGDLRGITGIYISQKDLESNIQAFVYRDIRYIVALTILGLILFAWLLKKFSAQERKHTLKLEKKVAEKTKKLTRQLYFDELTKLPNRKKLLEDLEKERPRALLLINIDGFKEINDIFGHKTADRLLQELAGLIRNGCRKQKCRLYRMPGDEFALTFLEKSLTKKVLQNYIARLLENIHSHEFRINEATTIHLKVAAGASFDHEESLNAADLALQKAKNEHKDSFLYDKSINLSEKIKQNLKWKQRIEEALLDDRVVPYFQPILSIETGKVEMVEALIRIVDSDGTVYTPFQFLEIAKKTRQYPVLTRRMVAKSLEAVQQLQCHISLNLSYLDIINPETMRFIGKKIHKFADPGRIHFEILESEGIEQYEDVLKAIHHFKELGCSISLDDFGSGYSNFIHLANMEADLLKIDGSLIRDIDQNISSQIIVESIIDFAEKLQMKSCAEFVGSKEIFETVKELGVDYVQGFYISEPKPLDRLIKEFHDLV